MHAFKKLIARRGSQLSNRPSGFLHGIVPKSFSTRSLVAKIAPSDPLPPAKKRFSQLTIDTSYVDNQPPRPRDSQTIPWSPRLSLDVFAPIQALPTPPLLSAEVFQEPPVVEDAPQQPLPSASPFERPRAPSPPSETSEKPSPVLTVASRFEAEVPSFVDAVARNGLVQRGEYARATRSRRGGFALEEANRPRPRPRPILPDEPDVFTTSSTILRANDGWVCISPSSTNLDPPPRAPCPELVEEARDGTARVNPLAGTTSSPDGVWRLSYPGEPSETVRPRLTSLKVRPPHRIVTRPRSVDPSSGFSATLLISKRARTTRPLTLENVKPQEVIKPPNRHAVFLFRTGSFRPLRGPVDQAKEMEELKKKLDEEARVEALSVEEKRERILHWAERIPYGYPPSDKLMSKFNLPRSTTPRLSYLF